MGREDRLGPPNSYDHNTIAGIDRLRIEYERFSRGKAAHTIPNLTEDRAGSPCRSIDLRLLRLENRALDAGMYEGSESVVVRFRVPNNLIDLPPVGEGNAGSRRIG